MEKMLKGNTGAMRNGRSALARLNKRKKRIDNIKTALVTIVAIGFAFVFLMPIILTITNSFMSASEINANYGKVFETAG